jgi:hypothetical protein
MKHLLTLSSHKLLFLDLSLILLALFYYLFFVNKGLVLADEGYYVHYAERIAHGQIPYKDFILQYTPGYFYLLAFLYKVFGAQILVGRFLSLFFCLLTLTTVLLVLHTLRITSSKIHILSALTITTLGYPLLHIPLVVWPVVFISVLTVVVYIYWYRTKQSRYVIILGFLLALALFFRQHLGLVFLLLYNCFLFFSNTKSFRLRIGPLLLMNGVWAVSTSIWVYFVFVLTQNIPGMFLLYEYNKQFISTFPFSYPPLTFLLQPTGFFKLLPYYYPIFFALCILYAVVNKQYAWEKLSFACVALVGFFATVYPASDLLHVYPFLGLVIVSSLLFFQTKKYLLPTQGITILFIFIGIYLTFFTKSFRYEDYFLKETTPLSLPKTKGILVDSSNNTRPSLVPLSKFITAHTKKNDYIFVYPFAPMLYFVLDRQNPTGIVQFTLLEAPDTIYPEERVIHEIKNKKVKYIIAVGAYKYQKKLSRFIQRQKTVYQVGPYIVYEIQDK